MTDLVFMAVKGLKGTLACPPDFSMTRLEIVGARVIAGFASDSAQKTSFQFHKAGPPRKAAPERVRRACLNGFDASREFHREGPQAEDASDSVRGVFLTLAELFYESGKAL